LAPSVVTNNLIICSKKFYIDNQQSHSHC